VAAPDLGQATVGERSVRDNAGDWVGAAEAGLASARSLTRGHEGLGDEFAWLIVELAVDGLVVADEQGAILLANDRAEAIFGYRREQLVGMPVEALVPERFRDAHRAHRAAFSAAPRTRVMGSGIVLVGRRADASEFPLEITLNPVSTTRGLFTVLAIREAMAARESDRNGFESRNHRGDGRAPRQACVLVVEDAASTTSSVVDALDASGFAIVTTEDGAFVIAADAESFDAVVLNLDVPSMHGLALLQQVKTLSDVPVLVVSGSSEEDDRLRALRLGADDYVTKPFSPRELGARVRAVLRRAGLKVRPALLAVDDIAIDLDARTVTVAGQGVQLTPLELDLLVFLARTPRHVYSRAQLLREVWGSSASWQTEATVTEHVRRLRRKIEASPNARRRIVTVQRAGYRFDP
jgi:PAS domain S-box-containing protein